MSVGILQSEEIKNISQLTNGISNPNEGQHWLSEDGPISKKYKNSSKTFIRNKILASWK